MKKQQLCENDVLEIRPYESLRPRIASCQHLVPSFLVEFDRYTFLTRKVEVGRCPAAARGKKTTWVYPYVFFPSPCDGEYSVITFE